MFKRFLPHIVAVLTFIVVTALYFTPQYEGKDLRQWDDIQAKGMKGGITEHVEKYGEHPSWAPNMFSGMPAYLIDMNYQGRLLKEGSEVLYFMGRPAAYYFILMAGFYFMLLCFGVNPWVAIVGGVTYGLSTYFFIIYEAGHITKLIALCYVAPLVGAVFMAYRKNMLLGASLAGIFTAVEISASHPQIAYYFLFVIFALFVTQLVQFIKENRVQSFIKRSVALVVAAALGVGANIVQLWYINDYAKDSIRSKSELTLSGDKAANQTSGLDRDYITAWSYGKGETFNLLVPNLYGGSSMGGFSKDGEVAESLKKYNAAHIATQLPAYWGPQPSTSGPVYIGAIAIFLFIFGMFLLKGREKWWLLALTIFSFALAWGKNMMWLTNLFIDYFPAYNKMRTVSMILVIAEWTIPFGAMLAINRVFNREIEGYVIIKALKKSIIAVGGLLLIFALFGGMFFDFIGQNDYAMQLPEDVVNAMISERESLMKADTLRSLCFVLLSGVLLFLFAKSKIEKPLFIGLIAALVLLDMVPVNKRFLNNSDFKPKNKAKEILPTDADLQILQDRDLSYRVVNLTVSPFNDATTSYFHKSIGGYHAAKMRRYQEVIDAYLSKMNMGVYNMLNTKYFIQNDENNSLFVSLNDNALGNGWFVDNIIIAESVDEEFALLGEIDPATSGVVNKRYIDALKGVNLDGNIDSLDKISLTDYRANRLTYSTESSRRALAVFSEIFYKGWSCTIDGEAAEIINVDYILRGVVVPEGSYTVEFKFEPPHYKTLVGITYGSSILLILGLGAALFVLYRKK